MRFALCWGLFVLLGMAVAAEAPVSYRLVQREGRNAILSSTGELIPWLGYGNQIDTSPDAWIKLYPMMTEAGIHLYHVNLVPNGQEPDNPFGSLDGKPVLEPRASDIKRMIAMLLERDPRARFVMRMPLQPALAWRKEHLDHYQVLPPGVNFFYGFKDNRSLIPSLASEPATQLTERYIHDFIGWCERQAWRDRVVAYLILPAGEGTLELSFADVMFDTSPVMQQAFREYARGKYATDEALRKAWGEPTVTLDTVAVPTKEEWMAKKNRLKLFHWPDPAKVQRERDYFDLQKVLFHRFWGRVFTAMQQATAARPAIKGYDISKQHQNGWMINANFGGDWKPGELDTFNNILLASGSLGVGPLLDHPGLDVIVTPGMYFTRAVGYAWETEGLTDSLTLRGKSHYGEADIRTYVNRTWGGRPFPANHQFADAGVFLTPQEMRAGFDRTLAWAISRNQMYYFTSVCGGNWWYHDATVQEQVRKNLGAIQELPKLPWRHTADAICIVVDDDSPLYEDYSTGYQHLAVFRQIEEGLALCGVPYRIHLLSDLEKENFPEYKCYLFPNLFLVDDRVEALLRKKVLRNGHVAIFGPATGITDGTALNGAGASKLLGIPMEVQNFVTNRRVMIQDHGHPITAHLPAMTITDSYAYGPLLVPKEERIPATHPTARALGAGFYKYFFDRPGPFVNDFGRGGAARAGERTRGEGDYAVVFTPVVPLPPEFLRACARYAGCHIWSEKNVVVYASDNFVALHTATRGPQTIKLPLKTDVWDLATRKRIARNTNTITVTDPPPATRMFYLGTLPR